jgi:hypothetical protein
VPKVKLSVRLSGEHCSVNTLWFKVMEIPISHIEIEPVKVAAFLCIVCKMLQVWACRNSLALKEAENL